MEYVYLLDMAWESEVYLPPLPSWNGGTHPAYIKYGSIVTDVYFDIHGISDEGPYGDYFFTDKETGKRYKTAYGWAFAENTPDNVVEIEKYIKKNKEVKLLKKEVKNLHKKITTLENKNISIKRNRRLNNLI